jgi:hypothetical protein
MVVMGSLQVMALIILRWTVYFMTWTMAWCDVGLNDHKDVVFFEAM